MSTKQLRILRPRACSRLSWANSVQAFICRRMSVTPSPAALEHRRNPRLSRPNGRNNLAGVDSGDSSRRLRSIELQASVIRNDFHWNRAFLFAEHNQIVRSVVTGTRNQ